MEAVAQEADRDARIVAERRLRDAEAQLREKSRLLEAILERMVQGLMLVNADRIVEVCNARAIELLGLPPELMNRQPSFTEVLEYQWSTDEFIHTPEDVRQFVRQGGILDQPHCYDRKRPDGRVIEINSVPLEGGGVLRTYTDITERTRIDEQVRHRARHDGLTSLVNRDAFLECVAEALAIGDATRGFAVHYLDLDDFKPVNDRFGHAVGDRLLALVAERLRVIARDGDIVARMGGDEFAILQPNVDGADQALRLAGRVQEQICCPVEIEGHAFAVGVSIGIALYPGHGTTTDNLIRNADAALYVAKSRGGNNSCIFEQAMPRS